MTRFVWPYEDQFNNSRIYKPRRDLPMFEGEDFHKWLYKYNQYSDLEEIVETNKLKLTSYYLNEMALY
jgi:hypothetical protein